MTEQRIRIEHDKTLPAYCCQNLFFLCDGKAQCPAYPCRKGVVKVKRVLSEKQQSVQKLIALRSVTRKAAN